MQTPEGGRRSPAWPPRRRGNAALGEVAFGVDSEAGAWDRMVWDDHLPKVQVQEGPGLRGSHAGYTDSGGANARESGDKTVGHSALRTEFGTWRRCRVRSRMFYVRRRARGSKSSSRKRKRS